MMSSGSIELPRLLLILQPGVVAHRAVDVDLAERNVAHELHARHDHARDPEEDDLRGGHERVRRIIELQVVVLLAASRTR